MSNPFVAFFTVLSLLGLNRQDIHQPLTDAKISFVGHTSVEQSFVAHQNNLNMVSMCIRNPGRSLIALDFNLYEATAASKPVRTLAFSGGNVDEQDCTRFKFVPIEDSQGKKYIAEIKARAPEKEESHYGMYFESYGGSDDVEGNITADGQVIPGDLHFKTFYRANVRQTVHDAVRQFGVRLGQDLFFFIPYAALVLYIGSRLIIRKKRS